MKDKNIEELIGRYLAGETDEDEQAQVRQWISESDDNRKEFELHSQVWEQTTIKYRSSDSESFFRGVLNRIDEQHEKEISSDHNQNRRRLSRIFMPFTKIAATFLLLGGIAYILYNLPQEPTAEISEISMIQKVNPVGQKLKTFLPDGSEVWLNAESKLTYPEKFTGGKREVILEGEAFFSVVRNAQMPFIVKAGNLSTTVLGTSFDIRAYSNEMSSHVALEEGSVKVAVIKDSGQSERLLEPGQALKYDQDSQGVVVEQFDLEELLSWKDGKLVFKNADLEEITSTLRRWYGAEIEISPANNRSWEYTGSFENKTLEDVLSQIAFAEGFSFRFLNPKHIIINLN